MRLRISDYLKDAKEYNGVSLSAKLQCTCGCSHFEFSHTGRQTKGILWPLIVKKKGQLILKAVCRCCGNAIIVYDSTQDGARARGANLRCEFVPLAIKSLPNPLSVVIKYNYFPEKMKTGESYSNQFENCFIYVIDENGKEEALIEE